MKENVLTSNTFNRISNLIGHIRKISKSEVIDDELDQFYERAEEIRIKNEKDEKGILKNKNINYEKFKYIPYLIVPSYVEESTKKGQENRERKRQRVKLLYDLNEQRAQTPAFLDVS
jgi:hypothetical protein